MTKMFAALLIIFCAGSGAAEAHEPGKMPSAELHSGAGAGEPQSRPADIEQTKLSSGAQTHRPAHLSAAMRASAFAAWRKANPNIDTRLKRIAAETRALLTQQRADRFAKSTNLPPLAPTAFRTRDAGTRFWECPMCPEMIVAPAGVFTIGSPDDEQGRAKDEGPQRGVLIPHAIAVSRFEVTRGEYEAFVAATNHPVSGNCITDRVQLGQWTPNPQTNLRDPGYAQSDSHPVVCVSWNDAQAYVAWLNTQTPGGYRLLSEAEWEYLARAGSTTAYPWGPNVDTGCAYMNGSDRTARERYGDIYPADGTADCNDGALKTAPVGSYRPNAFGIYDMIGNVGEWVGGCASASYANLDANGRSLQEDCARHIVRGASWGTYARQTRSAERIRYQPTDVDDSIGIRVAKTL